MSPLVSRAVNKFINLNVAEQVSAFPGPVRLIRRNRDEMISTTEGELWSNRGNALLEAVLRSRYPGLATPEALEQLAGVLYYPGALEAAGGQAAEDAYSALVATQWDTLGPEMGGELKTEEKAVVLGFIASKMMTEVDTTHCTPLPTSQFLEPWRP